MALADIIGIIGIIVAVAALIVAVVYGRKALTIENRTLNWSFETTPLNDSQWEGFESMPKVSLDADGVHNPQLLRLTISNPSPLDIESARFDKGRPLIFNLTADKFAYSVKSGGPEVISSATKKTIEVGPEILKSRATWAIDMITEFEAAISPDGRHLRDVEVTQIPPNEHLARVMQNVNLRALVAICALFFVAGIAIAALGFAA